ncbi:MAG: hypothetical protein VKL59_13725 [Nostocaceae cyanobacterium]|nr:hypothetical protein [Nostocaceae cyanobacterium]
MKKLETWKFGVQVLFSAIVLTLCVVKLAEPHSENNPNIGMYWGGLSGVLAYWLPSPANGKDEDEPLSVSSKPSASETTNNVLVQPSEESSASVVMVNADH